jgi:hypothetical protein
MCTVTLELSDELVAVAEKQGLLTPSALEAYIRKSLDEADNPPVRMSAREALNKGRGIAKRLGSTLTVDRCLELGWQDKTLENSLDTIHRKERMQLREKKQGNA